MGMKYNGKYLKGFVGAHELKALEGQIRDAHDKLHNKTGLGSDFLGWVNLPTDYNKVEFERIKRAAARIQQNSQVLIVIGIGGSYLGARAAIELLRSPFYNSLTKDTPDIYFAGNNLSPAYLCELLSICEGKDISVNVISKSGTTTEPALAFRVFRELLESKYGKQGARERIFCTTDAVKGTLKELCNREGYETFIIPDDVGGRFSVLTAVGLLPIAVSGADIDAIMEGAKQAQDALAVCELEQNDCYQYAAARNCLYRKGKSVELLVSYDPAFAMMSEWFKQLFGESEGKDNKGLYPSSVTFSTDLHSMGQFVQEGSRLMFETVVNIQRPKQDLFIKEDPENFDGLNFLSSQNMSVVSQKAFEGTVLAHTGGGVPNILLEVPEINEHEFGYMVYFFEKACAVSGYLLGVNPFDQPGVESYKGNMFALLGKSGYESQRKSLEAQING